MTVITNIEDLKTLYRRRVPKMFYDYAKVDLGQSRPLLKIRPTLKKSGYASAWP